ncbi:MAG: hypothetical protein EXR69_12915 [Myxococcales bacterium]|nr:hypothetical protein [Myxococcales bacterium]
MRLPGPAAKQSPRNIAGVGGGPSGLTAALLLARAGHQVTVYEGRRRELVYGLPILLPHSARPAEVDRDELAGPVHRTSRPHAGLAAPLPEGLLVRRSRTAERYVATSLNGLAPYFTASLESAIQAGADVAAAFDAGVGRLPI